MALTLPPQALDWLAPTPVSQMVVMAVIVTFEGTGAPVVEAAAVDDDEDAVVAAAEDEDAVVAEAEDDDEDEDAVVTEAEDDVEVVL